MGRATMRGGRGVRAALSDARLPNPINELYPARWGRAHMLGRSPGVAPQRRQSPLCAIYDSPLGAKKGTSHQQPPHFTHSLWGYRATQALRTFNIARTNSSVDVIKRG